MKYFCLYLLLTFSLFANAQKISLDVKLEGKPAVFSDYTSQQAQQMARDSIVSAIHKIVVSERRVNFVILEQSTSELPDYYFQVILYDTIFREKLMLQHKVRTLEYGSKVSHPYIPAGFSYKENKFVTLKEFNELIASTLLGYVMFKDAAAQNITKLQIDSLAKFKEIIIRVFDKTKQVQNKESLKKIFNSAFYFVQESELLKHNKGKFYINFHFLDSKEPLPILHSEKPIFLNYTLQKNKKNLSMTLQVTSPKVATKGIYMMKMDIQKVIGELKEFSQEELQYYPSFIYAKTLQSLLTILVLNDVMP
jgi:hypothetical protein